MSEATQLLDPATFEWISSYGYFVLVPLLAFEGPLTALAAGFLASLGLFNPGVVVLAFIVARLITDSVVYWLGRSLRRVGIKRIEQRSSYVGRLVSRARQWLRKRFGQERGSSLDFFRRRFLVIFVVAKFIPIPHIAGAVAAVAGAGRIPPKQFYRAFFVAQSWWAIFVVGVGYVFGQLIF